jgi:hypothetical protein
MRKTTLTNTRGYTLELQEVDDPHSGLYGVMTTLEGVTSTEWFGIEQAMHEEYDKIINEWNRGEWL